MSGSLGSGVLVAVGSGGSGGGLEELGSHVIWIYLDCCLVPGGPNIVSTPTKDVNIPLLRRSNLVLLLFFVTELVQEMGGMMWCHIIAMQI